MKSHIECLAAQSIIYMRQVGPYEGAQNFQLMKDFKKWLHDHGLYSASGIIYGIAQDNIAITPPEQCRYDVCFVTDSIYEEKHIHHGTLPHGSYLIFELVHSADEIKHFWTTICDILAKEQVSLDNSRPILERYNISLVENGYCEICLPIL